MLPPLHGVRGVGFWLRLSTQPTSGLHYLVDARSSEASEVYLSSRSAPSPPGGRPQQRGLGGVPQLQVRTQPTSGLHYLVDARSSEA
jgi:hypothetical protein